MPANLTAILIDNGISFFAGCIATAYGLGWIGNPYKPDLEGLPTKNRLAAIAIWAGPFLIVCAGIRCVAEIMVASKQT